MAQNVPKPKYNVAKIKERREKVKKLHFQLGLTEEETAKQLGVNRRTIVRDKKAIIKEWRKEFNSKAASEIVYKLLAEEEQNIEQLKKQYAIAVEPRTKAFIMSEMRRLRRELFDKLARLGIISTIDNKLSVEGDVRFEVKWVSEESED